MRSRKVLRIRGLAPLAVASGLALLAAIACDKQPTESDPSSTLLARNAAAKPAVVGAPAEREVETEADRDISSKNLEDALDRLEREIRSE